MSSFIFRAATLAAGALCFGYNALVASAMPAADIYASLPEITQARVSPDGAHVAMLQPVQGQAGVTIYTMGASGSPCAFAPTDVNILSISWASSKRLLVNISYVKTLPGEHKPRDLHKQILIDLACKDPKLVLGNLEQVRESLGNTQVVGRPTNDFDHILVASFGYSFEIYKVDPETGTGDMIYSGSSHVGSLNTQSTQSWQGTVAVVLDANSQPRIRYDENTQTNVTIIRARDPGSDNWEEIYRYSAADSDERAVTFSGFSATDPNIAYAIAYNGADKQSAYEFNLKSKTFGRLIYQDPKVDVDAFYLEPFTRRVVGVQYDSLEGSRVHWLDQSWAQIDADLHATFENSEVFISSATADRKKFTVFVDGPQDPGGAYYFYDSSKPEIFKIGGLYPRLTAADVSAQRVISYKSRDGKDVAAYLTIPAGSTGKNMPLVVMPHGGPAARDSAGFDWWSQFVASRGFVVLQPEFRGSQGFGRAWETSGHHRWGLEMQNDVSDGVQAMISQGIADPKKVCIVGWSYGGYAAMAGVTLTPQLYKCGIAVAGVSNLITMLGYEANHYGMGFSQDTNYWPKVIGDPTQDGERLRATSPAMHADAITASFLMIHGKNDTTVPIEQSEQMAQAMDKAGKHYQFVRVDGDDHQMRRASSRKQMMDAMDKFLQEQLK